MDRLNTQAWFSSSSRKHGSDDDGSESPTAFAARELPIAVELGSTTITLGELLDIRKGDVIRLDRGVDVELPIRAGKRARFHADRHPGRQPRHPGHRHPELELLEDAA